ncbi:GH92 family glycosyl hydrolase [Flavobacterium sp.]|uniref:GH92 family glycosyl hydrolase n=1 Tax=Flavobacterium sp. TaxID=239 RepID=UPI00260D9EC4|nr:GH92 family glycosyl hydrolase [Flavobacterium sp.]
MEIRIFLFVLGLFLGSSSLFGQKTTSFVNVFIGTEGTGHTFPGPSMPFGMVQPGPDNRDRGWSHTSGYQYRDTLLLGFSQTRLSGTGINELGDILILPIHQPDSIKARAYDKSSEKAKPGWYHVRKKDGVEVDLTCSERVAFHRYRYPSRLAHVRIDFRHGLRFVFDEKATKPLVISSAVTIENDSVISGYCQTQNWVNRIYFFTIHFSKPFQNKRSISHNQSDQAPLYAFDFQLDASKELQIKVALSSVDVEGAKANLTAEIPHWDFQRVYNNNRNTWENYLNRLTLKAPRSQKVMAYTALYHLLLQPMNMADVDGKYRAVDDTIRTAVNHAYYSTLSNWDVYRAAFPLLQLITPEIIPDIIESMLVHHEAKGFLPIWTVWGQDNYCMIGNHAIPMIVSAYVNGFTTMNTQRALRAMVETSTRSHIHSDWEVYNRFGYYPFDLIPDESVSRTLESGYDDWCVAHFAQLLGDTTTANQFYQRSQYYRRLFDPDTRLFRGKNQYGAWRTPFYPLTATSPLNNPGDYTEANAWQYFWTPTQHDLSGVVALLGGKTALTTHLDTFFTTPAVAPNKFLGQEAMIGQYAHGNEPSHHIAYLYAFSDRPLQGHHYLKRIINEFHKTQPDGLIGNDDCGQMSAWYLFTLMGFYPVNPASGEVVLGAPQVKKATLKIGKKILTVQAPSFSKSSCGASAYQWNGLPLLSPVIPFRSLTEGGNLTFKMTASCEK